MGNVLFSSHYMDLVLFTLTAELVACAHGGVNAAYVFTFFLARKEIY